MYVRHNRTLKSFFEMVESDGWLTTHTPNVEGIQLHREAG